MPSRAFGLAAALAVALLTVACRPTIIVVPGAPQPLARRDTVVVRDTIVRTDTVVSTVVVRPELPRREPVVVPSPVVRRPPVEVRDTVISRDSAVVRGIAVVRKPDNRGNDTPAASVPRELHVPPGHHPPEGRCRVWFEGRPPGQQPPHVACDELRGNVPAGAFVIYAGHLWDADFDWAAFEAANPGSVPQPILALKTAPGKVGAQVDDGPEPDAPKPADPRARRPGG